MQKEKYTMRLKIEKEVHNETDRAIECADFLSSAVKKWRNAIESE